MLLGKAEKNVAEGREGDPRTQDFPPLSLPAINQVTWRASGGRSRHSKECLTLAMGPKSLLHRVTNFTLPASTLPGRTASSPSPFPPTLVEERPNKAWGPSQVCLERGKAKSINLYQSPSWPGTSSRDLVMGKHFQGPRVLYCFFQLREIPQHSLREERQETVGWEWGVYVKQRVRKTKQ